MSNTMMCVILAGVVLVGSFLTAEAAPLQFYVATNGNNAWTGKLSEPNAAGTDGPFATLDRAREEIRALKRNGALPEGGVEVVVRGGVYSLDAPFELAAEDSCSAETPIVYSAAKGEEVRLVGGKVVTGFKAVSDPAVLERLDEPARANVLQADLKALGIADFGSPDGGGMELFFGDKPMTPARWPNEGFVRIVDLVEKDGHKIHGIEGSKTGKFVYEGDRPSRWKGEKDGWLHGYWFWDWSDQRQRIESIDTEKSILSVVPPYHNYGYRKGQWYYAFNMLTELDAPGEWYADRDAGILYFWPPAPIESAKTIVSVLPTLVTMKDVSFVTLRGMILEAVRGTAVTITDGAQSTITACTIRNTGADAVSVSGGTHHTVTGCDMYGMGGGGIGLSGGDRATLEPAGHCAENNLIHDYGRWYRMYRSAISLSGVGNRAAHKAT